MSGSVTNGKATDKGERWAKLAARAVADRNLTATHVRVLAAIAIYAGRDGTAWPSQETIGTVVGIDRATVCRAVKRLRQGGYGRGHSDTCPLELPGVIVPAHLPRNRPVRAASMCYGTPHQTELES